MLHSTFTKFALMEGKLLDILSSLDIIPILLSINSKQYSLYIYGHNVFQVYTCFPSLPTQSLSPHTIENMINILLTKDYNLLEEP